VGIEIYIFTIVNITELPSFIFVFKLHKFRCFRIKICTNIKSFENPVAAEELKIQRYTSFLDVYKFYPEKEGTYTFFIKYYYWADLNGDGDFSGEEDKEIFMVREKYTFVVI